MRFIKTKMIDFYRMGRFSQTILEIVTSFCPQWEVIYLEFLSECVKISNFVEMSIRVDFISGLL